MAQMATCKRNVVHKLHFTSSQNAFDSGPIEVQSLTSANELLEN